MLVIFTRILFFLEQCPWNEHQHECAEDGLNACAVCHKELNHVYDIEAHQHEHNVQRRYACDV
jgi:hypothetical protein